jgi:hypothetical protein
MAFAPYNEHWMWFLSGSDRGNQGILINDSGKFFLMVIFLKQENFSALEVY